MNKLVFGDIEVSKKEFHESKKHIKLSSVDLIQLVILFQVIKLKEIIK